MSRAALTNFEESVGGRQAVIDTIALAVSDVKQTNFLKLLADPARAQDSLATVARDAGVSPSAVIEMFRSAAFASAHAQAVHVMARDLPSIVADVNQKAVDRMVTCPECFNDPETVADCLRCKGRGEVFKTGDFDRQKLAYEAAGLLKKSPSGGVSVSVNQGVAVGAPGALFSKLIKATDASVYDVSPDDFKDVEE